MRVGINGMGRIGRLALRAAFGAAERGADDPRAGNRLEVVHVNEIKGGAAAIAHLLAFDSVQGRWRLVGAADFDLLGVSSRLSTLDTLGSYRLNLRGGAASGDTAMLTLSTLDGALRLTGSGQWAGAGVHFRGEASAAEGQEAALNNLLNIIGRRQGALSVISIG